MKQTILKYLKNYSYDSSKIDRLIVSAYLYSKNINVKNNKLLKEYCIVNNDSDYKNLCGFLDVVKFNDFEQLIEAFEFVISPKDKVVTGAVYTPKYIRDFIIDKMFDSMQKIDNIKICDPACGCAGFLYLSAKELKKRTQLSYKEIFEQNIYGLDIQSYSIHRSKLLLTLFAISEGEDFEECDFNLFVGNALNFNWYDTVSKFAGFDCVVGNPPYVSSRHVDDETKKYLKNWKVCSIGRPDLYIPFFEIGYRLLKENGFLGYITMNSFFKSLNGRALRNFFKEENCKFSIYDFGSNSIFKGTLTYTCICLIEKQVSQTVSYIKIDKLEKLHKEKLYLNSILYTNLDSEKGWNLQNHNLITKIESIGIPLNKRFKSRNGIATLKNSVYVFEPQTEDNDYYYFQLEDNKVKIEKNICRDLVNTNQIVRCQNIRKLVKKIIFPYSYNTNINILSEEYFQQEFPFAYSYLESYKNLLSNRDKGNGNYNKWYAYGRNQSLEKYKYKLFIPHITDSHPETIFSDDEELLFVNGSAFISNDKRELLFLQKILISDIFWFYIKNTSKHYNSNYYSVSKVYINNFGVYNFSEEEIDFIIKEKDRVKLNELINDKYGINYHHS